MSIILFVVEWNVWLKVAVVGFALTIAFGGWVATTLLNRHPISALWWVALGVLFVASALTALASQVTIVSRISEDDGTDNYRHPSP